MKSMKTSHLSLGLQDKLSELPGPCLNLEKIQECHSVRTLPIGNSPFCRMEMDFVALLSEAPQKGNGV